MKYIATLLLSLLLTTAAVAETSAVTLSWTAPTKNEDGSNFTDFSKFKLYYGTKTRTYTGVIDNIQNATYVFNANGTQPVGQYYFVVTAVNSKGQESGNSNEATKAIVEIDGILKVTNSIVYTIVKQPNSFVLLPIGSVPLGTECDPLQTVNGKYVVPTDKVTWTSQAPNRVEPDVVVADCS